MGRIISSVVYRRCRDDLTEIQHTYSVTRGLCGVIRRIPMPTAETLERFIAQVEDNTHDKSG
jgi:hypothetical protein